jgi:DNA-binding transcriptional ArsR family regulator
MDMTTPTPHNAEHLANFDERIRLHLLDSQQAARMAEMLKALADPVRVRILSLLNHAPMCVTDLCLALEMSQPAISHHLRILRHNRLLKTSKDGKHVFYALADEHIKNLYCQILDHSQHS